MSMRGTRIRWLCAMGVVVPLAIAFAAACNSNDDSGSLRRGDGTDDTNGADSGSGVLPGDDGDGGGRGNGPPPISGNDGGDPTFDAGPDAVKTSIHTLSYQLRCKLITNRNQDEETDNHTHSRFNLRGTDLGIPVAHNDTDLYFFFGDTAGSTIWKLGPESLPDAVGYSGLGLAGATQDPSTLCSNLKFLQVPGKNDFAGGAMAPPSGKNINEFIHNPAGPRGKNAFPSLPGDFEVPSGAFSYNGSIYVFYTIINHDPFEMRGSYLAKWASPSTGGQPNYQILHHVDQRFDANGPMRGDFINIASVVYGDYVYLYGTGAYRKSSVSLARKRLIDLENEGGYERFDANTKAWVPASQAGDPVIVTPAGGEFSVQYFPEIKKFMTLDSELGLIMARFADAPEGPWTEPVTVVSTINPAFAAKHCCFDILNPTNDSAPCVGEQLLHCTKAGLYGAYAFPKIKVNDDKSFEITFTISTWDPYSVALMSATLIDD